MLFQLGLWKQKQELISVKTQLDSLSINLKEVVSEDEIRSKISKKVVEIEKILFEYIVSDKEKQQFLYTFERSPILLKDDSIYSGTWNVKGQKHGYGVLISKDGSKYVGIFDCDTISGLGRYIDASGTFVYEGKI